MLDIYNIHLVTEKLKGPFDLYKYISFLFILLCSKNRLNINFYRKERKELFTHQQQQLPKDKQIMHYIIHFLFYGIYII